MDQIKYDVTRKISISNITGISFTLVFEKFRWRSTFTQRIDAKDGFSTKLHDHPTIEN